MKLEEIASMLASMAARQEQAMERLVWGPEYPMSEREYEEMLAREWQQHEALVWAAEQARRQIGG